VVLVAFEYTPATAGELDRVAETLLGHLAERGHSLVTVSQVAAGLFLADRIGEGFDGLAVHPLGFLPGESAGLRLLGGCLADSANCDVIAELADHEAVMEDLQQIGLIVVLTGERDSLVNWLEQVGTQTEVPIVAGITQSLAPIASPYLASGQLSAVVDGFPSALAYGRLSGNGEEVESTSTDKQMAAYILAQWLVIIIFVIGVLYYRLAGLIPTKMKKREP
jgi:hypothetical protein